MRKKDRKISRAGDTRPVVFYRIKKVKGRYYLVKEWWDPVQKRKRSLSLGNCEKIEEMLWRRGRDLNPGVRLDNGLAIHPQGKPPSRRVSPVKEAKAEDFDGKLRHIDNFMTHFLDARTLREFKRWLETRGVSQDYIIRVLRYLVRHRTKYAVVSRRLFLAYLEEARGVDASKYLKLLKTPQSRPDLEVPSEEAVRESLRKIDSERVRWAYLLVLSSALRPAHAAWILGQSFDWVDLGGYFRAIVNIRRGRKRAYVAYSLEKPPRLDVAANWLSNYAAKKGIVRPKYVRKFAITKMHAVGMSGDVVRFIAGHTDVHTARYFDVLPQADREYRRYAEWLRGFLVGTGVPIK